MQKLFIYGTLELPNIQRALFNEVVQMTPATLNGYYVSSAISDNVALPYKTIIKEVIGFESIVKGYILNLTDAQIDRVDAYEAFPFLYQKVNVTADVDGDKVECFAYMNTYYYEQSKNK